jgi:hypothetical protein
MNGEKRQSAAHGKGFKLARRMGHAVNFVVCVGEESDA